MTFTDDSPSGRRSVFTDLDLKRFKKYIDSGKLYDEYADEMKALLARLEAAEVIARLYEQEWPTLEITRNWRKAAGK